MTTDNLEFGRVPRTAFALNALVAWAGVGLNLVFSLFDMYDDHGQEPGLYGGRPSGWSGAAGRVFDSLSYFTVWSNIVVGVALTVLLLGGRATFRRRVLHVDALLMITVTGVVYQVLLAPTATVSGVGVITNALQHVVTPIVTLAVWLVWGPRGWINPKVMAAALGLPLVWTAWVLVRGAFDHTYPYGFANVNQHGYAAVLTTVVMVMLFGFVVELVLWGLDRALPTPRT